MAVRALIALALSLCSVLSQNTTKQSVNIVVMESTGALDNGTTFFVRYLKPLLDIAMEDSLKMFGDSIDIHVRHIETISGQSHIGALAAKEFFSESVNAFFGPASNEGAVTLGFLALQWNVPVLTPRGNDMRLRNITFFPTVVALHPFDKVVFAKFIMKLFQHYGWKHISIFMDVDKAVMTSTGEIVSKFCVQYEIDCYSHSLTCFNCNSNQLDKELLESKGESRVNLLFVSIPDVRLLMVRASSLGMLERDFVYIVPDIGGVAQCNRDFWSNNDSYDQLVKDAFRLVMLISLKTPSHESFEPILSRLNPRMFGNNTSVYVTATFEDEDETYTEQKQTKAQQYILSGYYNSFLMYLTAVNETLALGGNIRDGTSLVKRMCNRTYLAGSIDEFQISDQANRVVDMEVADMLNEELGTFETVVYFKALTETFTFTHTGYERGWPADGDYVADIPSCGLLGQLCNESDTSLQNALLASFVIIVTIIGVSLGVILRLRHIQRMNNLYWWRIQPQELQSLKLQVTRSNQSTSLRQVHTSTHTFDTGASNRESLLGFFKGQLTQMHTLPNIHITVNSGLLKEFEKLKDINHPNLLRIIGACLEGEKKVIVTEYCQKGSLQMLLMDPSFKFDEIFSLCMLSDIVRALTYIHKHPLRVHGRLTSEVCMIDSRFSVKVGFYGLPTIYDSFKLHSGESQTETWLAPELVSCPDKATQKGDIYSFAVIMSEVLSLDESYGNDNNTSQVLSRITKPKDSPRNSKLQNSKEMVVLESLMNECMSKEPEQRPSLHRIHSTMHTLMLRTNQSGSLVDNLLQRLEKYSTNLERIVDEKVEELSQEKQRSEELLRQMLPTAVVDRLKSGLSVEPEFYDCVTIYFSDVVGFTDICSMLEPVQIVKLLNDLYSCFDEIIGHFDVYKVETIGDAYMVVSGLPTRNGNEHARQIARMSLVLLTAVTSLEPANTPTRDRIKLRIGLNSGPVCAGVVGHKMPRYCLFGDAVNTASRMESNGFEMKVHISSSTAAILETFGTFSLESRGLVNIKGKGILETFWLLGENIFQPRIM